MSCCTTRVLVLVSHFLRRRATSPWLVRGTAWVTHPSGLCNSPQRCLPRSKSTCKESLIVSLFRAPPPSRSRSLHCRAADGRCTRSSEPTNKTAVPDTQAAGVQSQTAGIRQRKAASQTPSKQPTEDGQRDAVKAPGTVDKPETAGMKAKATEASSKTADPLRQVCTSMCVCVCVCVCE